MRKVQARTTKSKATAAVKISGARASAQPDENSDKSTKEGSWSPEEFLENEETSKTFVHTVSPELVFNLPHEPSANGLQNKDNVILPRFRGGGLCLTANPMARFFFDLRFPTTLTSLKSRSSNNNKNNNSLFSPHNIQEIEKCITIVQTVVGALAARNNLRVKNARQQVKKKRCLNV